MGVGGFRFQRYFSRMAQPAARTAPISRSMIGSTSLSLSVFSPRKVRRTATLRWPAGICSPT